MPDSSLSPHSQRERILMAAKAVFLEKGYNGSKIRDIAKEAEMSLGGLYHHFSSKEDLYTTLLEQREVAQDFFQLIRLFQAEDFPKNLTEIALAIAKTVRQHKDSFKLFYIDVLEFKGKNVQPFIGAFRDQLNALAPLILAKRSNELKNFHPAIVMRIFIDFFLYAQLEDIMLDYSFSERLGLSDEEVFSQMADIILHGVLWPESSNS